jgi:hypothetical protein
MPQGVLGNVEAFFRKKVINLLLGEILGFDFLLDGENEFLMVRSLTHCFVNLLFCTENLRISCGKFADILRFSCGKHANFLPKTCNKLAIVYGKKPVYCGVNEEKV